MFGVNETKNTSSIPKKGQAVHQPNHMIHTKKSVATNIAVYGTSTIVGKAKPN